MLVKTNSSQLEAFFTVAKVRSFTQAADLLGVTQSALSQRIAKLEEDLESTLLIRDRGALRLTEAGEQVLRFCQLNEHAEADLLSTLKQSSTEFVGSLRVGGFSSVNRSLLLPALKPLLQKNPLLSVNIITREMRDLGSLLKSAEVDYILTSKKSDSADVESLFLGYEDNVLVRSKKFPATEIYLDHDAQDPTTQSYFRQNKIVPPAGLFRYLDDVYGLLDGVKNGFGQAVLPMHLIEHEKELEMIEPKKRLSVPVYLHFYAQPYYKKVHNTFLGAVQGFMKLKLRQ